ncbi:MAG: hypothetical protein ACRENY_03100 [Candidatus Dormibacteria bacterium]
MSALNRIYDPSPGELRPRPRVAETGRAGEDIKWLGDPHLRARPDELRVRLVRESRRLRGVTRAGAGQLGGPGVVT